MPICKIKYTFDSLINPLILNKMKKIKLIFGLLMVSAFVAVTVLSYTSSELDNTAVRKDIPTPRQG